MARGTPTTAGAARSAVTFVVSGARLGFAHARCWCRPTPRTATEGTRWRFRTAACRCRSCTTPRPRP
eukprot:3530787-Prymnesium_polylepis.1